MNLWVLIAVIAVLTVNNYIVRFARTHADAVVALWITFLLGCGTIFYLWSY